MYLSMSSTSQAEARRSSRVRQSPTHEADGQYALARSLDLAGPSQARTAVKLYRQAAEDGHVEAANLLAESLRDGNGVRRNGKEAMRWFRRAAAGGSSSAQLSLGYELFNGRFVRRNRREALSWYQMAARAGEASAKFNLAQMYERGEGVGKNVTRALHWYTQAARHGHVGAARRLAEIYGDNPARKRKALHWLKRSAALGDARSLCDLGVHFHEGDGVPRSPESAVSAYMTAAKLNDAWAQYLLGLCYRDGDGVRRNSAAARKWFTRAAATTPEARKELRRILRASDKR